MDPDFRRYRMHTSRDDLSHSPAPCGRGQRAGSARGSALENQSLSGSQSSCRSHSRLPARDPAPCTRPQGAGEWTRRVVREMCESDSDFRRGDTGVVGGPEYPLHALAGRLSRWELRGSKLRLEAPMGPRRRRFRRSSLRIRCRRSRHRDRALKQFAVAERSRVEAGRERPAVAAFAERRPWNTARQPDGTDTGAGALSRPGFSPWALRS